MGVEIKEKLVKPMIFLAVIVLAVCRALTFADIWAVDILAASVGMGGTIWDVNESFSDSAPSKDVWSYGLTVAGYPGDFWAMTEIYDPYNGQDGVKARYCHSDYPDCVVAINTSDTVKNYLQPGQIGMQANKAELGWREALIRWTSPGNGTVRVQCSFGIGEPDSDKGCIIRHVRGPDGKVNSTEIHEAWTYYTPKSLDFLINVHTGDKLDFIACNGSSTIENEMLPFDCKITAQAGFNNISGWDLVEDFSTTQNPNGPWTCGYGFLSLLDENQFIPYPRLSTDANEDDVFIEGTVAWKDFWAQNVMYNIENEPIPELSSYNFTRSRVALSGNSDLESAVRWTSPGDGTVVVTGGFGAGYSTGESEAWIIKNGMTIIDHNAPVRNAGDSVTGNPSGMPFSFEVDVNENDTLDFVAGTYGCDPDSTMPLNCTIYPKYGQFTFYDRTCEATLPFPENESNAISKCPILTWSASNMADSHDVYFGTNLAAVSTDDRPVADLSKNGSVGIEDLAILLESWLCTCTDCADFDDSSDVDLKDFTEFAAYWMDTAGVTYQCSVTATQYTPSGSLVNGTTYYWRVDEVNGLDVCKGQVWSFTVSRPVEAGEMVLHNPDMGWVLQDAFAVDNVSSSMIMEPNYDYNDIDYVTIMLCWSDIEPNQGIYDFNDANTVYDYWKAKGKEITLRLSTCSWLWWNNATPPTGLGVPQYILDTLPSGSKQVRNAYGIDYTVVDARETFYLTRLEAFLDEVAAHFDPNGTRPVGIIDLGGFGVWGEWHSGFIYGSNSERRTALMGIIDKYSSAFSNHTLAISYSYDPDGPLSYHAGPVTHYDPAYIYDYDGYLNYSAFDYALTKSNVTLRRNGCAGAISSNERKLAYDTFAGQSKAPFTSEFAGDFFDCAKYVENGGLFSPSEALDDALDLHPNYILTMGWDQHRAKLFIKSRPDLVARGLREMGYRFVPVTISTDGSVTIGQSIAYNISWVNKAVGKAIRDYELRFVIRNLSGDFISEYNAGAVNTSVWIKGGGPYTTNGSIPNSLGVGTYRLCVSVYDTETDGCIELPLVNNFDGTYEIAIVTVN